MKIIKIIRNSRNPSFIIVKDTDMSIKNFKEIIPDKLKLLRAINISEFIKIEYFANGQVAVYNIYEKNESAKIYNINETEITFETLLGAPEVQPVRISQEKKKMYNV